MKNKWTIAVTGLNAIDSPGPGVGVIRCLREIEDVELRIIGLSYESLEPGIYMTDLIDKVYQIPYPQAGSKALLERLEYIHQKEQLTFVLPNFDAELSNFITLVPALTAMGIHSFLPTKPDLEAIDKMHLYDFGQQHRINVPVTHYVTSSDELINKAGSLGYPTVIKGKYYEAYIARNEQEALAYYYKLQAKWGLPIIVQQFVSGTEIVIAGLGDGTGQLMGAIPLRKLYITDKGKGWAGVTLEDEPLLQFTHEFIKESKWKGGFELELMRADDDTLHLMEINPRFPAWIYTTAAAGQNLPAMLVKLGMGENPPPYSTYTVGKLFIRYSWDLVTDISAYQQLATTGER